MQAYIEYGIDFDNNRFGIGRSTEIECANNEIRTKANIKIENKKYYLRVWIGKKVFSYSANDGFKIKTKNRNNFKFVFGIAGDVSPSIHLVCGFIGFGKTTLSKKLETSIPAKRYTHDDYMFERYGRTPDNFQEQYNQVDAFIRKEAEISVQNKHHVILDYGFWSQTSRKTYYEWAKKLTDNVFFHVIDCDMDIARQRTFHRTQHNDKSLFIDEESFNDRLKYFQPYQETEKYPFVIKYKQ